MCCCCCCQPCLLASLACPWRFLPHSQRCDRLRAEGSCRFTLAPPFLAACATGASADCCDVLAEAARPVSTAPLASCLCLPSLWDAAVAHMQQQHRQDLSRLLSQCIEQHGKVLLFRGGPLTWCPAPA